MTDVDELAEWFPGVDREVLEETLARVDPPRPADVAVVLDALAERDLVPPGDYLTLLVRQREDGLEVAACEACGKMFLGEDVDAAQRSVNGHKSSHRVEGHDDDDGEQPASIRAAEQRLEERIDREAGEYPTPEEAMADLEAGAEAEREAEDLEADGGGE